MTFEIFEIRKHDDRGEVIPSQHKVWQYPGGESDVTLNPTASTQVAYVRGADANDYMKLAMWAEACHENTLKTIAIIPYLPGARADHQVPLGATIYADWINSMGIREVVCFDPHSDVMPSYIDNLTVVPLVDFIPKFTEYDGVIIPDKGAKDRAQAVADKLGVPAFQALKHRDPDSGKLSGFSCEELPEGGKFLVVDDICDGGGTFIGLAKALDTSTQRFDLWVSHGIFSGAAFDKLTTYYGNVFTTDSHPGAYFITASYSHVKKFPIFNTLIHATSQGEYIS